MRTNLILLALAGIVVVGCNNAKAPQTDNPTSPANASGTASTAPTLDQIPAELKHEGFEYYGLAHTEPIDMEYVNNSDNNVITGAQQVELVEMRDGDPIFRVTRTGGLSVLGVDEISLKSDGIYTVGSSILNVQPPPLLIASNLEPGHTWENKLKADGDAKMDILMKRTVKGTEKFTTKVGEREGLLILSTGSGTINDQKVQMDSKEWYVRGLGPVKQELTIAYADGKKQVVTIQETQ
jgi:hypothetical protein